MISRSGNQTQMQMYNTQKQQLLGNQSTTAGSALGASSQNPQSQSAVDNKNTVNINMNIMNIGLQGQLIGVNGPVHANHNVIGVNNGASTKNSKGNATAGAQHKRSQS